MSYSKSIGAVVSIIIVSVLIYSNVARSNIAFAKKPPQASISTINPINEVESGSIIYTLNDRSSFTQMALDTKVQMDITGTINRTKLSQTFVNPSNEWVEGVYVFPLPTNSAVDHLTMHIGKRTIEGQIKERKEAKRIYTKAKQAGKKASLIEQQRPNIFTTNVANIAPGESITISIEYQQIVSIDNDKFSIRFPMTIGKRYIPGTAIATPAASVGISPNTHRVKDASKITPPISQNVDRPISIAINLKAGFNTASVNASYHDISVVDIDTLTKHITLDNTKGDNQADRDFELVWQANNSLTPELALFTQQQGDDHYLMLMATPPADKAFKQFNTPRELIFIIDSSGSMMGASMIQASKALVQAINRLKPTDRFNIIDFDSGFDPLFDSAMPAISMNKKHGIRFANNLDASGGTEPLEAIKFALNSRDSHTDDYLRQIVFLTDGQVGNEDEIFRSVRQNIDDDRMFTIGIGSAPNSHLMTKLAKYGKGAYTFIGDIAEVKDKMTELFDKLESPAMTDININFPMNINAEQALGSISDLYKGEVITAVYKLNAIPNKLSISGNTANGVFTKDIHITASNNTTGIDVLWARRKIDQLMNQYRAQYRRVDRDRVQADITNIALDHHLVSKFTSLVAVDITPAKPGIQTNITKTVANKVKAAKTATNSQLWMMFGLVIILLSVVTRRREQS
ncbi:marine proteobacterial sortase target protein [Candidatus Thioglobus sp.]|jgi:Ca-activated chloride channel family protein|uniref:marine proteobacterial sortase target protein n=1 Tax=Candidatus Thioglobus sp. TaxID=2026721 RepID=UPI001775A36C|nr:marine proteobacterial sortase target protein [Candidatus Thioglobus sp.]HIF47038.1 marine proteobacterial sortase target protein [Candidatus Thioglobus sp.]HIL04116.1 marine proteobacterial sortase target protein [Candidatus Thioglobus autotrophicus]